jgi:hypothetical protein
MFTFKAKPTDGIKNLHCVKKSNFEDKHTYQGKTKYQ